MDFPRLLSVEPRSAYRLFLRYADGVEGEIDVSHLVRMGNVFAPLADAHFFERVQVINDGEAIAWPDEIDLCADSLYLQLLGLTFEQWQSKQAINA